MKNELHWKTERIVDEVDEYVMKEIGIDISDFLLEEAQIAEDEVRTRYATYDYEKERYVDLYEIDIDECFDDDDWEDIKDMIMYHADDCINFYKEQNAV